MTLLPVNTTSLFTFAPSMSTVISLIDELVEMVDLLNLLFFYRTY